MNPSIPALALLLAAAPLAVRAQGNPANPGTQTPHSSGDWGKSAEEAEGSARKIMKRLLDEAKLELYFVTNYRDGTNKDFKVAYAKTPDFEVDFDNKVIGGSPAAAFSAGLGMNAPGRKFKGVDHSANDLVYSTQALYEMADQAEAAIFLAHEIGHLALGHAKKLEDEKKKIVGEEYDKWVTVNTVPDDEPADVTVKRFFRDGAKKVEERMAKIQAPMEEEADAYGRELAARAKFPAARSAESAFQRAQDWLWVYKLELADPAHGASVADRAKESATWAAAYQKAQEKAKTDARRAKCASEGQSCQ